MSWCIYHHKSKRKWPSNQDISWKRFVSLSRYVRGGTWKLNVQLPIRFRKFLNRSYYLFCRSVRTCIMLKQVNILLYCVAFKLTWLVSLCCGSSLETSLDWLRFVVNFFCFVLSFVLFTDAISDNFPRNHAYFLSEPYSLCFAINLTSLFYPNARDILLMMATWMRQEHNKK